MVSANISLSRRFLALTSIFSTAFDLLSNPPKNIVFTILSINYHRSLLFQGLFSKCIVTIQKREKIEFGEKWHTENSIRIECFGTAAASFLLLFCFSQSSPSVNGSKRELSNSASVALLLRESFFQVLLLMAQSLKLLASQSCRTLIICFNRQLFSD